MTQGSIEVAPDITALVLGAQAGDQRALSDLIAVHLPLIYNVVGRALNGHVDVDDLVQETILRVIRGLPGLRDPDRFRSWAVTIAYRQVQRYLRDRRKAMLRTHDAAPLDLPDPSGDFAERAVTELMLTGQRLELAQAARWLDDRDRQLLALWWQEAAGELTRGELSAALAIKPQHAAVRLQRMKTRLDSARCVVRALRATPRCPDLADLLRGWSGGIDPLWRKRLIRHTRDCARCGLCRRDLVAPENLLLGVSAVPLPIALIDGLRSVLDAALPAVLAPAAASTATASTATAATAASATAPAAGKAIGHSILAQLQGFLQNKAAAAAAMTVMAGSSFAYAVHETPLLEFESPTAVTSPTAASGAGAAPPGTTPSDSASPTPRSVSTGVSSADVYVAPNGSDAGDGSAGRPFATLNRAVAVVRPGQTIALRGGTYRPTESVIIGTSGEPERRITLSNYRDERPVIDASQVPADKWMVTHRGDYWTVQGLEFMNSRSHAYVCTSCRDNVFRRLSMHHNVRSGLTVRDPDSIGNQVLDSDFYHNYDPADRGRSGVGLAIKFGAGDGNVVRGCRAFNNADTGFDVGHFASPVRLEYNWSYGNGANRWNATDWQANADGFLLGGGSPAPAAAHVLRHNAAWDNVGHGFTDGLNPGAPQLSNNTAFRNGGSGFNLPAGSAVLRGNAAIGNRSPATLGDDGQSSGNTWDGGDWTEAMFRSTDPTSAQGQRRPDGGLPATGFLESGDGFGAAMIQP
jgi:RNA polymerase sigma factor (sigma-70 family)